MTALPIDARLPAILAALKEHGAVVVQAEPGAGKTTRVPPAVAKALPSHQQVLVLEPRRLAARTAAQRVAAEVGEVVGQTVGTMMRFERRVSKQTRIIYVTEAVLSRWLARDQTLQNVGAVVFDEVHERHLHGDLALAMVEQLRRGARKDLWSVAMSATLDTAALASFLRAPTVVCSGRQHPVAVEHERKLDRDELPIRIAKVVRRLCREGLDGHALVFLDGSRSIEEARRACSAVARDEGLKLCSLFGGLSREDQDAALAPSRRRKIVFATNIAESSVTIDGVVAVVDSGLAKTVRYDRGLQRPRLLSGPISRASAIQRAGRAGRTAPGRCIRLYTEQDFLRRPEFDVPEIERIDLSGALLLLACGGALRLDQAQPLRWLTEPPKEAIAAAKNLLEALGALDPRGHATSLGREMVRLPLHPRLARVAVEAKRRNVLQPTLLHVAELTEGRQAAPAAIGKLERQLQRLLSVADLQPAMDVEESNRGQAAAWLCGFADRVVRKSGADRQLAVADGGRAAMPRKMAQGSCLGNGGFGILLSAQDGPSGLMASRIMPLDAEHLLDEMADHVELDTRLTYSSERRRVEAYDEIRYRGLLVERSKAATRPGLSVASHLVQPALALLRAEPKLQRWLARVNFAAEHMAELSALSDDDIQKMVLDVCNLSVELPSADALLHRLQMGLSGEDYRLRERVEEAAPQRLQLIQDRQLIIHYPRHEPPFVESYLQDFFGMTTSPTVALGRLPLVVKLWAPNKRPIQVTTDLLGFWQRHYPELRRRLSRRYPKHHWPENPGTAAPIRLIRHLP